MSSNAKAQANDVRPKTGLTHLELIFICGYALFNLQAPCGALDLDDVVRENYLRAGYLLNFAKFVEWTGPADIGALTFCFVGGSGIRDSLNIGTADNRIRMRPLVTRMLTGGARPDGCQILYIETAAPNSRDYTKDVASPALLTVSDARNFVKTGGIVELFSDSNRLRFNVNLSNARRAGLKISSSLLQLASHVDGAGQ